MERGWGGEVALPIYLFKEHKPLVQKDGFHYTECGFFFVGAFN
jgi:hypothetical protein